MNLPVCEMPGTMDRPKKLSNKYVVRTRMNSTNKGIFFQVIGMSPGGIFRVTVDLAAHQNEDAGCYGKQCQDNSQAAQRDERGQACENEPYGQ